MSEQLEVSPFIIDEHDYIIQTLDANAQPQKSWSARDDSIAKFTSRLLQ